jgi:hypothetical protein
MQDENMSYILIRKECCMVIVIQKGYYWMVQKEVLAFYQISHVAAQRFYIVMNEKVTI